MDDFTKQQSAAAIQYANAVAASLGPIALDPTLVELQQATEDILRLILAELQKLNAAAVPIQQGWAEYTSHSGMMAGKIARAD